MTEFVFEHMRDAARDIIAMTQGRTRADLDRDMLLRRAMLNAIQEIGEAAARASDPARALVRSCRGAASWR